MQYFIASDFHLEFRKDQEAFWEAFPKRPEVKTCIVAGDFTCFSLPQKLIADHFLRLCERFENILYVPGNHEYYGDNPSSVDRLIRDVVSLCPQIKLLTAGNPQTINGQRFIGDTMWFPDRHEVHMYRRMINDTFQIKDLFPWCFTHSSVFINYLRREVKESDIIVTHHIPTDVDTAPIWKGSQTQPYFLNKDAERYLAEANTIKPKAWIYGHTHTKHDYVVGRTRFICNPIGYPGENGYLPEAAEPTVYEI